MLHSLRDASQWDELSCVNGMADRDHVQESPAALQQPQDDVENCRAALQSHPPGYDRHLTSLVNPANRLADRFERRGTLADLDRVIELHRAALLLHPPGYSDRPTILHNLANGFQDRFKQRSILSDLDEAIEHYRAALLFELNPISGASRLTLMRPLSSFRLHYSIVPTVTLVNQRLNNLTPLWRHWFVGNSRFLEMRPHNTLLHWSRKSERGASNALECVAPELAVVVQRLAPVVSLADGHATVQGALDALNRNQSLAPRSGVPRNAELTTTI